MVARTPLHCRELPPCGYNAQDQLAADPHRQPDKALANVLRRLCEERQISAEGLAQQAALNVPANARIEAAVSAPGWSTVERIAQALGVNVEELGPLKEAEDRK